VNLDSATLYMNGFLFIGWFVLANIFAKSENRFFVVVRGLSHPLFTVFWNALSVNSGIKGKQVVDPTTEACFLLCVYVLCISKVYYTGVSNHGYTVGIL